MDIYGHIKILHRVKSAHLDIFSEVTLRPNEDERSEGGVSPDLRDPLLRNVLERGGTDHAKAQQEHICTGVTQRTQLVKLILGRLGEVKNKKASKDKRRNSQKPLNFHLLMHSDKEKKSDQCVVGESDYKFKAEEVTEQIQIQSHKWSRKTKF